MKRYQQLRRRLYRGRRAGSVARALNSVQAQLAAHGIGPKRVVMLQVRGRKSGRTISFPVVVADLGGQRYVVSMLGESVSWVRNVRAAGGAAVLRHGASEEIRLEEVAREERPPILRRYLDLAPGARPHIPVDRHASLSEFQRIAGDYPVFRVVTGETA